MYIIVVTVLRYMKFYSPFKIAEQGYIPHYRRLGFTTFAGTVRSFSDYTVQSFGKGSATTVSCPPTSHFFSLSGSDRSGIGLWAEDLTRHNDNATIVREQRSLLAVIFTKQRKERTSSQAIRQRGSSFKIDGVEIVRGTCQTSPLAFTGREYRPSYPAPTNASFRRITVVLTAKSRGQLRFVISIKDKSGQTISLG